MHITPGERPAHRDQTTEPIVRPRGVPLAPEREIRRLAIDDADRHPLPPPLTSNLDDAAVVVITTTAQAGVERENDRDRLETRRRAPNPSRGFLESHGADGEGWLAAQRPRSGGWLDSMRTSGWLRSLAARRRAAESAGWMAPHDVAPER